MTATWNMQWAAVLVAGLSGEGGIAHAVVSPGSRNTPLVLALDRQPDVRCHVVLDERIQAKLQPLMALQGEAARADETLRQNTVKFFNCCCQREKNTFG